MIDFINQILGIDKTNRLSSMISIEFFDEQRQAFLGGENYIRVLELNPRVGLDSSSVQLITDSFSQACFKDLNVTITLFSRPNINNDLLAYQRQRNYHPISIEREKFFKSKTRNQAQSMGFCRWSLILTLTSSNFENLNEKGQNLISALKSCGLSPTILGTKGLFALYNAIWQSFDPHAAINTYNPLEPIGAQLTDIELSPTSQKDNINWNEHSHSRTFFAKNIPQYFSLESTFSFLGDALRESFSLKRTLIITALCHVPDQNNLSQNYLISEVRWRRQAASPMRSFIPDIDETVGEFSALRENIQSGEKLVQQGLIVSLICPREELNTQSDRLRQYFSTLGFKLSVAVKLQIPIFMAHLPGVIDTPWMKDFKEFGITKTLLAKQAAQFFPLQAEWSGSKEPQSLLVNRQGGICFFDPFDKGGDKGNFNISITGKSGSGKSNFMAYLVLERLLTGGQCFIIDVGYSYQNLGLALKGKIVEFSDSNVSLNPFSALPELNSESLLYLKPLLSKMCFRKRDTTELEDSLLEKALRVTWDKWRQKTTLSKVSTCLEELDSTLGKSLSRALYPFSEGVYSEYFDKPSTINFSEDFIIFELEDLKDKPELQEVVMLTLIFKIQAAMYKNRHRKKYLVVDEAWQMLGNDSVTSSSQFLENIARRIRKFNGSLIVGTQGLDDFFTNKCGEAIFYNSDWLISLAQKDDAVSRALSQCSALKVCERALKSVRTKSGEYSEALIKSQSGYSIMRLYLNEQLLKLFSTDASDIAQKSAEIEEIYE